MRRLALLLALVALAAPALASAFVEPASARQAATCTAKQKRVAHAALVAYRKAMPKQRAAYYRTHRKAAQRKAFVKKQQSKLKALTSAASCKVASRDTTAPQLTSASANGSTVTVRFSEDVSVADAAFIVYVNGAQTPLVASADGKAVALALAQAVGGDDVVVLDYRGGVRDAAGNAAAPALGIVVANATPAPCSFMVGNNGLAGPGAMNEGPTDTSLHPASVGELRGIVLWVDFPDAPATESIATLTDQIFQPAVAAYTSMSYGKLALRITASGRWYRLPQASTYYGLNTADGPGRKDEYIAAAVRAADADVDFSRYDTLYLVPAAGASADQAAFTIRSRGSGLVTVDGTEVRNAVLLGSDRLVQPTHGSEQIIHETGHALGLPDLYADPDAVASWDPMSFSVKPGAEFMAWHRWKLGWLDPSQVRCAQPGRTIEATLTPLEASGGLKMIVAPIDATHALVIENRQPLGLDSKLCDKGVLVYTVNGAVDWRGVPIRVAPARAGTDTDEAKRQLCGRAYDAPLDLGPGEVSSHQDAASGVRIELLAAAERNYVIRVSR